MHHHTSSPHPLRLLPLLAVLLLCTLGAAAQASPEAKKVLEATGKWTSHPQGADIYYTMKLPLGITMKMNMKVKGENKMLMTVTGGVAGERAHIESGYDGSTFWMWDSASNTLQLGTADDLKSSDMTGTSFSADSYRKCKMTLKDGVYEITLSKPIDDSPSRVVVRVRQRDNMPLSYVIGSGLKKVTLIVTRIRHGVSDSVFTYGSGRYPGATIQKDKQ